MNAIAPITENQAKALANVVLNGDLSQLSDQDKVTYYRNVCESVGLNPFTRPFEYIRMPNGKTVLYVKKDATEQLRMLHGITLHITDRTIDQELVVVSVRATNADGRHDEDIGAVTIAGLKGEARANAIMKAITKAKRRATLSICGLGMLDESEIDSIQGTQRVDLTPARRASEPSLRITSDAAQRTTAEAIGDEIPERIMDAPVAPEKKRTFREYLRDKLAACFTLDDLRRLETDDAHIVSKLAAGNGAAIEIQAALKARAEQLSPTQDHGDDLGSGLDDAPLPNDPVPDMAPGA